MRFYLNGREMPFKDGGYEYVFVKPYQRHQHQVVKKDHGELTLQLYDNGVQIRTLVTRDEAATIINRDIAVDFKNFKIYILENGDEVKENPDGSVEILYN
ncbi:hypothetical protein [Syntrophomonas palmitatica]|uniref:hypothetical protein n=1 Tax=Syntrophomonas palmitatica TaxID=402877 RepID=UPI0006D0889C|nr:hypothetical protein [Syntrophomonas palmitatica]